MKIQIVTDLESWWTLTFWCRLFWPDKHFVGVSSIVLVVADHFEAFGSEGAAEVPLPDRGVSLSPAITTGLCPGLQGRRRVTITFYHSAADLFSYAMTDDMILNETYLKDETVILAGVLSQGVFPRDRELCSLWVCPVDARISATVDLFSQPRDEQRFGVRHFYRSKKNCHVDSRQGLHDAPWVYSKNNFNASSLIQFLSMPIQLVDLWLLIITNVYLWLAI